MTVASERVSIHLVPLGAQQTWTFVSRFSLIYIFDYPIRDHKLMDLQEITYSILSVLPHATLAAAQTITPPAIPWCYLPKTSETIPPLGGLLVILWASGSQVEFFKSSQKSVYPDTAYGRGGGGGYFIGEWAI